MERYLSSKGLWQVVSGSEVRPPKPPIPTDNSTIDQRLWYERLNEKFVEWEGRSDVAYYWIKAACSDHDAARIEASGSGQAAMMILQELYEPTPQQRWQMKDESAFVIDESRRDLGCGRWQVFPLYCLSQLYRYGDHGHKHNVRLKQEVELLASRCKENGYPLPRWMICRFFRKAMNLDAAELVISNDNEMEERNTEHSMDDITQLLRRHGSRNRGGAYGDQNAFC